MVYLVETGDMLFERSNGDLVDDSGGVRRGVGEGEIRGQTSRGGGSCISFATGFPVLFDSDE